MSTRRWGPATGQSSNATSHSPAGSPAAPSCSPGSPLGPSCRRCQGLNTLRQEPSTASLRHHTCEEWAVVRWAQYGGSRSHADVGRSRRCAAIGGQLDWWTSGELTCCVSMCLYSDQALLQSWASLQQRREGAGFAACCSYQYRSAIAAPCAAPHLSHQSWSWAQQPWNAGMAETAAVKAGTGVNSRRRRRQATTAAAATATCSVGLCSWDRCTPSDRKGWQPRSLCLPRAVSGTGRWELAAAPIDGAKGVDHLTAVFRRSSRALPPHEGRPACALAEAAKRRPRKHTAHWQFSSLV